MTDIWQSLAGQETAKRAIEIAMVGGLPITFVPQEGAEYRFTQYDIDRLKGEIRGHAQARYDWYEGEPMSLAAATDTVAHVRAITDDLAARCGVPALDTTHNTADMQVGIFPISCLDFVMPPPAEGVDCVVSRVMAAWEMQEHLDDTLTPEAQALLNMVLSHISLSPAYVGIRPRVIEIARCISALGVHERNDGLQIGRWALAEAISYCGL